MIPARWLRASLHAHGATAALEGVAEAIDYRLFAERAQAVADGLEALGVGAGERVALSSGRRGHDEPIALAGILLAGAVAVPLDASAPALRVEMLLKQAGCRAIIHDSGQSRLIESLGLQLGRLVLDSDGRLQTRSGSACVVELDADPSLACVLHTSGSTGAAKPVPISWQGLDVFVDWMIGLTRLGKTDRVLRVAELSFDLSWFDHIACWRAGATLCTMSRRHSVTGSSLLAQVQRLQPKLIYAVPSLLMKLVGALPAGGILESLEVICFAGEVYPPGALQALALSAPHAQLFNLYGPTETNVCTFHRVDRALLDGQHELPIGRACPYADCELIDEQGAVVDGPGLGELVVRGPTALAGRHATRDRVLRGPDGLFYFRGRIDRMVKIRGYRVDPSEIEAALTAHCAVLEAAVVSMPHRRLGIVLRAFVTLRDELPEADRSLRKHLAKRLAPHMLVEVVEVVEQMPRTPTGKTDYSLLATSSRED